MVNRPEYNKKLIEMSDMLEKEEITQEQYDQLSEFYRIYSGLGGNGQAKEYYELALELPIKPE